jgi:RNA polymerase sigma factor (sigma-70 family)
MPAHPTARALRPLRDLVAARLTADVPDRALVERFAGQRDEAAFEALVRRHGPMVLRLCRRLLRHTQDAEDAFQATFLVLARKAAALRRQEAVGPWLYGVARRVVLKARARDARLRQREGQAQERAAPDPLAEINLREAQDILDQELLRLPGKYQAPLLLCCLEGLTRDEAAGQLGIPVSTLKSRLEEGRERLRRRLTSRGLTLSAVLSPALLSTASASAVLPVRLLAAAVRSTTAAVSPSDLARAVLPSLPGARLKMAALLVTATGLLAAGLAFTPVRAPGQVDPAPTKAPPAAPREPEVRKLDRLGDALPPGARMRLGTLRHQVGPSFHFLPDGKMVLTVRGHALHWVDMENGTSKRVWRLPPNLDFLGASADGRRVVLGAGHRVELWDTTTGQRLRGLPVRVGGGCGPGTPPVHSALISPDGRSVAGICYAASCFHVQVWDANEGRLLWHDQFRRNDSFRNWKFGRKLPSGSPHVRFSPDGKTLALLDDESHVLHVRDCRTGKEVRRWGSLNAGESYAWAFAPGGNRLVVVRPQRGLSILVHTGAGARTDYDVETEYPEARGALFAFARGGKVLLLAGADGKLGVYDWPPVRLRRAIDLGGRTPTELLPARDGRSVYLLFAYEKTLRRYDLETGKETTPRHEGHRGIISQFALAPDGKLVSAGYDGSVQVWDLARGRVANAFRPKDGCIFAALSGDGKLVAGIDWDHTEIAVHERDTGRLVRTIRTGKYIRYLAFAPNSRLLLSGEDIPVHELRVWDADTGREVRSLKAELFARPAFSADGRLLAAVGGNEQVRVLDFASGKDQFVLPDKGRHGLAFSPDGRTLACLDWKGITLWEMLTHRLRGRIELSGTDRTALRFSPDGCWLAWGERELVQIWDLVRNRPLHTFRGHEGNVTDLRFTPDGRSLISASTDSTLLVWDLNGLRRQ